MWVAGKRARFSATRPRVFCEKSYKISHVLLHCCHQSTWPFWQYLPPVLRSLFVILIYQIIQEKFAYGELFMLVMIGYIFMFKMVKKKSGLEIVAELTPPLKRHEWMQSP